MSEQSVFFKLIRCGVSWQKLQPMLAQLKSPTALLDVDVASLKHFGWSAEQRERWQKMDAASIANDLEWAAMENNHLITILDAAYPPLLKNIYDPPIALFVKGNAALLSQWQLAMVGSRNPTKMGADTAFEFAEHLVKMNLVITSGLATGVDAASHQGALAGKGQTIAVCGTGLDRVYPAKHRKLAQEIANNGALVSEFALGVKPQPYHFPRRNRIISGLSLGTLVVEAALKSGSLITARQAMEQGREVFAIPGSIHNPLARGCHRLLREGAKLVERAEDVVEELSQLAGAQPLPSLEKPINALTLDLDYQQLLNCIGYESTAVDVIVAQSGMAADQVASMLLILELNSHVSAGPGGYQRVK
jgi:DNA processing protein